jgi:hypothetical protein
MSRSDYSEHLKNSRTNIGLELASIADLNSKWDWLVEHLQIYLLRLQMICEKFDEPPPKLMQTSIFCNIIVAVEHAENILLAKHAHFSEWTSFKDSLNDLSDADDFAHCLSQWESIRNLKL